MKQPTRGAMKAAGILLAYPPEKHKRTPAKRLMVQSGIANMLDEQTHAPDMLAFIEKIAAWDFSSQSSISILKAQNEAFELLKKVRG